MPERDGETPGPPEDLGASERASGPAGIALCLSGGGYRAALFHLGSLTRLNELGLLRQVRMISSVSGGSITAGVLATAVAHGKIDLPGRIGRADWEAHVAGPLRSFSRKNIRGPALIRGFFYGLLPWNIVAGFVTTPGWKRRLNPLNWFLNGITGVRELERRYESDLTDLLLRDLPEHPRFVFCATDMFFAENFEFRGDRIGDAQIGYVKPSPEGWPLARAVAASSCFPPVFNPLPVPLGLPFQGGIAEREQRKAWEEAVNALRLTDGGNYDNMGLEPAWSEKAQLHELLLVSDAGGLLSFEADKDIFWRVQRYQAIQERQTRALRQRWLFDASRRGNPYAAYWSTRSATTKYPHVTVPGYSKELAREVIAEIRTDLDSFSVAEASVLENHGYCLAEAAVRAHVPPPFQPPPDIPFEPPHRRWMPGQVSEDAIRTELRGSDRQRVLGRWR